MRKFPLYRQLDAKDCGPSCLRMISKHYGRSYSLNYLREQCYINKTGVSLAGISHAAEQIGFRSLAVKIPFSKLMEAPLPCVVHWRERHFVVVYKISKKYVWVADPGYGLVKYKKHEFLKGWLNEKVKSLETPGIVLLLETTPDFFEQDGNSDFSKNGFKYLFSYITPYKKFLGQLWLGLILGSAFSLIFPFLSQAVVDKGIQFQDLNFVYLVLVAQIMLFFSSTAVGIIRSWILLHMSTRINISLVSNFLIKLLKLPISFFDTRLVGDILQRIGDHRRIQSFLTASTLDVIFSVFNLFIFGFVLALYSMEIFGIFVIGSIVYVIWVMLFLKKRKVLDFKRFDSMSENQGKIVELISGVQDIKLNNCERQKRWEWERIQAKLFNIRVESLALDQYQNVGASAINTFKNIIISFVAAKAVIDGEMTLGMMMAVQYIVGQVNAPVNQLIGFVHLAQDAKISLERLGEIHNKEDEEPKNQVKLSELPPNRTIRLENLTFSYSGPISSPVLKNLNMELEDGKVTAIVGASGSGKTTLLKLLLKFYEPSSGHIYLGEQLLSNFHSGWWRDHCGVVMQEGFIYSDTVAANIALGYESVDYDRLLYSVKVANIHEFIQTMPMGFNTKIGQEGVGISQGQRQRILIARAVYKNPTFLFFDEATSALDANNEKRISNNLNHFFKGRTVVVVAHRLSTVRDADKIIVLDKGSIVEVGTHQELQLTRGAYYNLVKNQLELGS